MNEIRNRTTTVEELIRRYDLESLKKTKKMAEQNKDSLEKTESILNQFIEVTTQDIANLQDQVDGNITTWFFSGIPTLINQPAVDWITDEEKNNHLGDLYYDSNTGYAYRFSIENSVYKWVEIKDNDVVEALAIANAAKDTADSKRRVFVVTPYTPYDVGDIWIKDDKDIYRCRSKRTEGQYQSVDWIIATDYTNDDYAKNVEAVLNSFKTTVETDYVTNVKLETTKDSIESEVSSVTTKVTTLENDINEDIENLRSTMSTNFSQQSDSFQASINSVLDAFNDKDSSTNERINEINNYIKYALESGVGVVTIGTSTSDILLKVKNDRISFEQNGVEVAYISNNILYITDGTFLNSLRIGNFAFNPRSNGSLSFRKVA